MGAKGPITETEIGFFFRNRGITPEPWEIDLLVALDLHSRSRTDDDE